MKFNALPIPGSAGLLPCGTEQAGSITRGDAIITDGQNAGQIIQQIVDHCGPPTA